MYQDIVTNVTPWHNGLASRVNLMSQKNPHIDGDPLRSQISSAAPSSSSTSTQRNQRGIKCLSISTPTADKIRLLILVGAALTFPMVYVVPGLYGALCAFAGLCWVICGASLLAVLGAL